MAKLSRDTGATSQIFEVFIRDSSSTTGGGLTGLTSASSGLTAYYHRNTDTTATAISLVTMTVGTFTSSGFKEIDATNMPGWYQFCPPNAALASGATSVSFHLKGVTNMAPLPIEVDLKADVNTVRLSGTAQTARDIGASVLLSNGTGTGQIILTSGNVTVGTNNDKTGYTASTVSDKTGYSLAAAQTFNVTGNTTGSISGSVGSVTTVSDKTGYSLAGTQTFNTTGNITGSLSGSVGSVTTVSDKTGYSLSANQSVNITGNITGNLSGSVGSLSGNVTLSSGGVDAIWAKAMTELSAVPGVTASVLSALTWVFELARNKVTQTATTQTVLKDDGTTTLATATVSDDGTTFTRGEFA